jgi:hypothetical protein
VGPIVAVVLLIRPRRAPRKRAPSRRRNSRLPLVLMIRSAGASDTFCWC